jgi:hypothetical protein
MPGPPPGSMPALGSPKTCGKPGKAAGLGDAFELDRFQRVEPHLASAGALRRLLAIRAARLTVLP